MRVKMLLQSGILGFVLTSCQPDPSTNHDFTGFVGNGGVGTAKG